MLTAVWMHLAEPQRRRAMPRVASLVRMGGFISMTLRHGPVPRGRRMFEVSANETIALAEAEGLRCLLNLERTPALATPNVSWTRLVFAKLNEAA